MTLPPQLSAVPFTVEEAREAGVPYARLRRPDLSAPFRGVRSAVAPVTMLDRSRAFAPRLRAGQAFCGLSAAALWGMWLPAHSDECDIEVLAIHPARAPRMRGVRGHHAIEASLALLEATPVTAAAETWCALAEVLALDDLVAAGDSLVRRKGPRCTMDDLVTAVLKGRGRRAMSLARRALPLVRARCDSPKETALRLLLARAGLPEPEVNALVSEAGERERFGDLVFREWRVIAEYDGGHHRTSARQFAADVRRLEELARAGWTVIRVFAPDFDDPAGVVRRVETALHDRGWRRNAPKSHLLRASPRSR